jgi:nitrate reductase delta subunit
MANQVIHLYEVLADLLEYPTEDWAWQLELGQQLLTSESQELMPDLLAFRREVEHLPVALLQEQYTRTFDLNPVCNLEIGYHLFGENYKRGIFLANLREMEMAFAISQARQLPDYLPLLLRLLVKLEDEELRGDLIVECLIPALEKMLEAMSKAENPYRHLMKVVAAALKIEAQMNGYGSSHGAAPAGPRRIELPVLN